MVGPKLARRVVAGAGHSLGEYSAYVAAGALTAAEGAKLVRRRGELMHEAGTARPGTMAAVLGFESANVVSVCREASAQGGMVVAANLNEPTQTVISGDPEAVARAGELLKAAGAKRVVPLKVSGAFHSPLMEPAQAGLSAALAGAPMRDPAFPVVANASAQPVADAATAKEQLTAQLVSPVRFVECARMLSELAGGAPSFIEIGPGTGAFTTPPIDLNALVWSRREPVPALDVPVAEVVDLLVALGQMVRRVGAIDLVDGGQRGRVMMLLEMAATRALMDWWPIASRTTSK